MHYTIDLNYNHMINFFENQHVAKQFFKKSV